MQSGAECGLGLVAKFFSMVVVHAAVLASEPPACDYILDTRTKAWPDSSQRIVQELPRMTQFNLIILSVPSLDKEVDCKLSVCRSLPRMGVDEAGKCQGISTSYVHPVDHCVHQGVFGVIICEEVAHSVKAPPRSKLFMLCLALVRVHAVPISDEDSTGIEKLHPSPEAIRVDLGQVDDCICSFLPLFLERVIEELGVCAEQLFVDEEFLFAETSAYGNRC